uniref:Protein slowmo n=1 Tax=Aceria tosichella TaxID=561515 RepID=A0A6G1S750_9ACAR
MRIWQSEHKFNHNWETVVSASLKKYPNPITTAVVGIDVLERRVNYGVLTSKRLILSEWSLPNWARRLVCGPSCFATETSEVDPTTRTMTLTTKNLTMCNKLSFEEKLTYTPHPSDPNSTLLKQEAVISVFGVPLSSYLEDFLTRHISLNANKGRQAIEWVINEQQEQSSC